MLSTVALLLLFFVLYDNLYSLQMVANNRKYIQYTIKTENNSCKLNYSTTYQTLSIVT